MNNDVVIGMDFGNSNSYTCFIEGIEKDTKMGGIAHSLNAPKSSNGTPSIYFYSEQFGEQLCENAVKSQMQPIENRLRYLKRNLDKVATIDGKTIEYNQAITKVIEHCVKVANKQLSNGWLKTTNLISLAYPATFTVAQKQKLIELAQMAKTEDGKNIKVVGTIAEPAAAALDYLSEFAKDSKEKTVLVYDLGGGTFDLALVSVFPNGKVRGNGETYYYDILGTDGIANIGGSEFDIKMQELIEEKAGFDLSAVQKGKVKQESENLKIELSDKDTFEAVHALENNGDYVYISVTKDEYQDRIKEMVDQTVKATVNLIGKYKPKLDMILLTGGASQTPIIEKSIKEAFPQYADNVKMYRPDQAIAFGAARFGATEIKSQASNTNGIVEKRVPYDIGINIIESATQRSFVDVYIKAGTPLPYKSEFRTTLNRYENQTETRFDVYESKSDKNDVYNVYDDFTKVMSVSVVYSKEMPIHTPNETRLVLDKNGILLIEAREKKNPKNKATCTAELESLR